MFQKVKEAIAAVLFAVVVAVGVFGLAVKWVWFVLTDKKRMWTWVPLMIVTSFFAGSAFARQNPTFECAAFSHPRIKCVARFVDSYVPEWRVYYPDDIVCYDVVAGMVADYDRGIVVYLTIADDKFVEIEMTVDGVTASALGRWHNGKVEFKETK